MNFRKGSKNLIFINIIIICVIFSSTISLSILSSGIRESLVNNNIETDWHLMLFAKSITPNEVDSINEIINKFDENNFFDYISKSHSKLSDTWTIFFRGEINKTPINFYLGYDKLYSIDIDQTENYGYISSNIINLVDSNKILNLQFGDNKLSYNLNVSNWKEVDNNNKDFSFFNSDSGSIILPVSLFFNLWADISEAPLYFNLLQLYLGLHPKKDNFNTMHHDFEKWTNDWIKFYRQIKIDVYTPDIETEQGIVLLNEDQSQYTFYMSIILFILSILLIFLSLSLKSVVDNIVKSQVNVIKIYRSRGIPILKLYSKFKDEIRNMNFLTFAIIHLLFIGLSETLNLDASIIILTITLNFIINIIINYFERKQIFFDIKKIYFDQLDSNDTSAKTNMLGKRNYILSIIFTSFISFMPRIILIGFIEISIINLIEILGKFLLIFLVVNFTNKYGKGLIFENIVRFNDKKWGRNSSWMMKGIFQKDTSIKSLSILLIGLISVSMTLVITTQTINQVNISQDKWQNPTEGMFIDSQLTYQQLLGLEADNRIKTISFTIDTSIEILDETITLILISNIDQFIKQTNPEIPYFKVDNSMEKAVQSLKQGNILVGSNVLSKTSKSISDTIVGQYSIPQDVNLENVSDIRFLNSKIDGKIDYLPTYSNAIDSIIMDISTIELLNSSYISKIFFELTDSAKENGFSPEDLMQSTPQYSEVKADNELNFDPLISFLKIFFILTLSILLLTLISWISVSTTNWEKMLDIFRRRGAKKKNINNQLVISFSILFFAILMISIILTFFISLVIISQISNILPFPIVYYSFNSVMLIAIMVLLYELIFYFGIKILIPKIKNNN